MAKDRIISRNYLLTTVMNFFGGMNYFILIVTVAQFAMGEFHVSASEAGLSAGMYVIGGIVSRVFIGKYIEYVGRKRMLQITLILSLAMQCLYFGVNTIWMLYAVRFVHGMMYGISYASMVSIVSKGLPQSRRGEGMGYYLLGTTLAMCIGPMIGLILTEDKSYPLVAWIGVFVYIVMFVLSLFINVEEEKLNEEQVKAAKSFELKNLVELSAIPVAFSIMVMFISYSTVNAFLSPYTTEIGMRSFAPYFYVVVALGSLLSRFVGTFYDKHGSNSLMIPGFGMFLLGITLLATMTGPVQFFISGFLIGFGYSLLIVVGQAVVLSRVGPDRYGVTSSTFSATMDAAMGLGPMIMGAVVPLIGFREMYILGVPITLAAIAIYWYVFGRNLGKVPGKNLQKQND